MSREMHFFVIGLPIGNHADLGGRARATLDSADLIICEERRVAETFFRQNKIQVPISEENLLTYNEHSKISKICKILGEKSQKIAGAADPARIAWICDSGTPNFADPGRTLLAFIYQQGWKISPVPGPSALMAALSVCDFDIRNFYYGGFLSRQEKKRQQQLQTLRRLAVPLVLQEPPYRYAALVASIARTYPADWPVMVAYDLTKSSESIFRGTVAQLVAQQKSVHLARIRKSVDSTKRVKRRPEFMLILAGTCFADRHDMLSE